MNLLADTSVWIDHFRTPNPLLSKAISNGELVCHEYVIAELALGSVPERMRLLAALAALPAPMPVTTSELIDFINRHDLTSKGIGFVDAHLLISVSQSENVRLWTHDKRLAAQADLLGLGNNP